jgi:hypothetical protein
VAGFIRDRILRFEAKLLNLNSGGPTRSYGLRPPVSHRHTLACVRQWSVAPVKLPNRRMFVGDSRPDVKNPACERDC